MELENNTMQAEENGAQQEESVQQGTGVQESAAEPEREQAAEGEAEPQEQAEQAWKTEQNAENAQRRRMAEKRQRERYFAEFAAGLTDPQTNQPFASEEAWSRWKQDAVITAKARQAGVEPETAQKLVDDVRDTIRQTDPEYRRMAAENEAVRRQQMQQYQQQVFAQDMQQIRALYPDEKAKSVTEFGDEFMTMMASGQVDAVSAYEAIRAKRQRTAPKPPSTGKIQATAAKKGAYYTRDEVNAMSDEQIEKNYEDIRRSMAKW